MTAVDYDVLVLGAGAAGLAAARALAATGRRVALVGGYSAACAATREVRRAGRGALARTSMRIAGAIDADCT